MAQELRKEHEVIYVMKPYADGQKFIRDHGFDVVSLPEDSDDALIDICNDFQPERLICDLIETPYSLLFDYCRSHSILSIVFDTKGAVTGVPDMLINANISADSMVYPSPIPASARLMGPSYFMTHGMLKGASIKKKVLDVMITMGGSDPANLTALVLGTLKGRFPDLRLHIVLGPAFSGHDKIRSIVADDPGIIIYSNPPGFLKLLRDMDIVITAGGGTLYECAWLGRPTITIPSIDHEEPIADGFAQRNCAILASPPDSQVNQRILIQRLQMLIDKYELRLFMSKQGRLLVDGTGKHRILNAIASL
ncbi:glycosyltransferase [Maridesulfovibrio sp.]